jgi:uncharacterized phiE125 gp8 family phage protein
MGLSLVTGPAQEPLTIAEAKIAARASADVTDEDGLFAEWIVTAREYVENFTRRALLTQTWALKLDGFGCSDYMDSDGVLWLPKPPTISITSIVYLDTAGVSQTWGVSNYRTSLPSGPEASRARITPAYGVNWPQTYPVSDAVTVTFVAGYGAAPEAIPAALMRYMRGRVAYYYQHREPVAVGVGIGAVALPDYSTGPIYTYVVR